MSQLSQRRNFLKLLTASAIGAGLPLSACTHKKFYNPDEDILISGGSYTNKGAIQYALIAINLTQTEKRVIDMPFLAHDVLIDPNDKFRLICLQKNGKNACEINLQSKTVNAIFQAAADASFSGHAAFSRDGKKLYTVEISDSSQQGSISVRDAGSFSVTGQLPSLGLQPHDCQLIDNNILVVSNTGLSETGFHQPSLVYIDLLSEKLVKRLKPQSKELNCGHFEITESEQLVMASAPTNFTEAASGSVSMQMPGEQLVTMTEPELVIKRMTGEALSIAVNSQHQVAAVSHPQANLLTFWSLKTKAIIKAVGIENPRGINQTRDKKHFVVSYGNKPAMAKISADTLEPQADSIVQPTFTSGEHLINWSLRLREIMPTRIYG